MRAREFITEQKLDSIHDGLDIAALSLPNTFVIPELPNSDFYKQYRFGVAIAAVRGEMADDHSVPEFDGETSWGENQIVTSFDPNIGNIIDKALNKIHLKGKKSVSTPSSDEMTDTQSKSLLNGFKGFKK